MYSFRILGGVNHVLLTELVGGISKLPTDLPKLSINKCLKINKVNVLFAEQLSLLTILMLNLHFRSIMNTIIVADAELTIDLKYVASYVMTATPLLGCSKKTLLYYQMLLTI